MVLTILLFTYLGHRLDKYIENPKPIWTAVLAIFGVVIAMVFMLKAFMNPKDKKKKGPDSGQDNPPQAQ